MSTQTKLLLWIYFISILVSCKVDKNQRNYFEGKVGYAISFKAKRADLDTVGMKSRLGSFTTFIFKEGNYKQLYDLSDLKEETYLQAKNISYLKKDDTDTLWWQNMSDSEDTMLKFEINRNKERILDILCDELVLYYTNRKLRLYFNSDTLVINPSWFANFNSFNKSFSAAKMRSLFLKCTFEDSQLDVSLTAVSINPEKIDPEFFKIPTNAILIEER